MLAIKICLFNMQDFFVFCDKVSPREVVQIIADNNEKKWQSIGLLKSPNKPLKKCQEIAQIFTKIDADIFLLTEVGGDESMANFLTFFNIPHYQRFFLEGNSGRGIDLGYLVHSRVPFERQIKSHADTPLNFKYPGEDEKVYFSRDVSELNFFDRQKNVLRLYLVHLKSFLDPLKKDPWGYERRKAEVDKLIDIYLAQNHPQVPTIIGGDFNAMAGRHQTSREFARIYRDTDWEDIFQLSGVDHSKRSTHINFNLNGTRSTSQLDYLFLNSPLHNSIAKQASTVYGYNDECLPSSLEERNLLPSDHYPIVCQLDLSTPL